MVLERYDMRLQVLCFEKNPILPLGYSKSIINKHLDCFCPSVTVSFLNCYCLTSHQIFNYIWSSRSLIQAKFMALETYDMRLQVLCFERNPVLLWRESKSSLTNTWTITVQLLLSPFWTVTVWPLLRLLTISGVIELRFKQNLWHWKSKTWGYKFYVLRGTQFCFEDSQNRH